MDTNTLLTAGDVAARLKISKSLVYKLIADGMLPGVRFCRTVRIQEQDLISFIKQNITTSTGDDKNSPWR